jgi:hypothetical protein
VKNWKEGRRRLWFKYYLKIWLEILGKPTIVSITVLRTEIHNWVSWLQSLVRQRLSSTVKHKSDCRHVWNTVHTVSPTDRIAARYVLCLMFFLGITVTFLLRVNINLAIVGMVNSTSVELTSQDAQSSASGGCMAANVSGSADKQVTLFRYKLRTATGACRVSCSAICSVATLHVSLFENQGSDC